MQKNFKPLLIFVGVVLLALIGWQAYRMSVFHIVRTNPKLSAVSTISPYIQVDFNDVLLEDSLKISDEAGIVTSKSVKNKRLTLNIFKDLKANKTYTITITSVSNTDGELIQNKVLRFTANASKFTKLSKEQQQTLVNQQDRDIYDVDHLNYKNFDELTDNGITSEQLKNIQTALFDYSNVAGKKFWTMTVQTGSTKYTHERASTTAVLEFNIKLDTDYKARVDYNILYDPVHLQLYTAAGGLAYDSANSGD